MKKERVRTKKYFFFDYVWYRIARIYYKWDSDGITASAFISLSLGVLIHDVIISMTVYTNLNALLYPLVTSKNYATVGVCLTLLLMALFYYKYRNEYWRCRDHWMNESKGFIYYAGGLAVLTSLLAPWVIFFLLVNYE